MSNERLIVVPFGDVAVGDEFWSIAGPEFGVRFKKTGNDEYTARILTNSFTPPALELSN